MAYHSAVFVGALAAFHKYGDRTEITDKSLKGTKEALETLLAYLGRSLAEAVSPTIERILANSTKSPSGAVKEVKAEIILSELNGEAFLDDISAFVNSDIEQLLFYRNLLNARDQWSIWAKRISRGIFALVILQGVFTVYFFVEKIVNRPIGAALFLASLAVSVVTISFCILCAGAMLHHHDQISEYRDKVL